MMIWSVFWESLIRNKQYSILFLFIFIPESAYSQFQPGLPQIEINAGRYRQEASVSVLSGHQEKQIFPPPKIVLRRSLLIPGWGQITNKQAWKVPIVYGLLGGLTAYSVFLTKRYHDYRAAFFNESQAEAGLESDFRFGRTPSNIPPGTSLNLMRNRRNFYRNRRDLVYVFIAVSYALNVIDAYVFAHLRSFDVSDDLSFAPDVKPSLITGYGDTKPMPGITFSLQLFTK